ncbi:rRNA-processing protein fyv7 [Kluyveromyces marxianus]|nr:rRNA-processing protein fyv7 [Kluyveromyces marxianus]KAG0686240.1 rRNA-processing protein fyv7 [Kluyveromyces marxianus]
MTKVEKKKFTKEYRLKEIQKNLTKKARLKKGYLKVLKEEGYAVPEKPQAEKHDRASMHEKKELNKKKVKEQKEEHKLRKRSAKEKERAFREQEIERIKLAKQKQQQREDRAKRLLKKTRRGQPIMGPKINDLLDKIKNDDTYTG